MQGSTGRPTHAHVRATRPPVCSLLQCKSKRSLRVYERRQRRAHTCACPFPPWCLLYYIELTLVLVRSASLRVCVRLWSGAQQVTVPAGALAQAHATAGQGAFRAPLGSGTLRRRAPHSLCAGGGGAGWREQAKAELRRLLRHEPHNAEAQQLLQTCLQQGGT